MNSCNQKHPSRSGQGLTEYIILLVLISLVSIAAVRSLGGTIQRKIQMAREQINGMRTDEGRD